MRKAEHFGRQQHHHRLNPCPLRLSQFRQLLNISNKLVAPATCQLICQRFQSAEREIELLSPGFNHQKQMGSAGRSKQKIIGLLRETAESFNDIQPFTRLDEFRGGEVAIYRAEGISIYTAVPSPSTDCLEIELLKERLDRCPTCEWTTNGGNNQKNVNFR